MIAFGPPLFSFTFLIVRCLHATLQSSVLVIHGVWSSHDKITALKGTAIISKKPNSLVV